ncbi:hypothetical protein QQ045_001602 [Rhodiola kirilowii]
MNEGKIAGVEEVIGTKASPLPARVCILPKSVIQAVNSICARFLWRGNCDKKGGHLVKWDEGNEEGKPTMWSDWLEKYWSKGKHWWEEEVKSNSSWILKRMMQCKDIGLKCVTVTNNTVTWRGQEEGIKVKDTYNMLTEHKERVEWYNLVWNDYNAPRDSMNAWMAVQNKLMTRDTMGKWGCLGDKACVLCEAMDESRDHIYFDCSFSRVVWLKVMQFLKVEPSFTCWESLIPWFNSLPQLRLKMKLMAVATMRIMNSLWRARNSKIFRTESITAALMVQETIYYLKMKIGAIKKEACSKEDINWLKFMRFSD